MNKTIIASFLIITIIIILVALFYYINKQTPPITTTDTKVTEKVFESEKIPFDTEDNLDQAIDELKALDNL